MSPAISRDGKLVTYTAGSPGSSRIYLRQIDGQRPVLLSGELDGDHTKPAWSPDGSQIAFEAKGLIYTVPTLGGTPRPFTGSGAEWQRMVLTAGARATLSPSWSPDGTRMAYANAGGIWVKAMDGAPRRILEGQLFHSESWSPDGQALAFVEGVIPNLGNLSASVLRVTRLDGRRTTISDSTHVNLSPVWMPDGRTILYVSNRDGALDVYEQRLDRDLRVDGAPQRITTGLSVRTISVSADGTRLAYDVVRNRSNLWQIPIPATGIASFASAKQITTDNQRIEAFSISHDGQWLAYDSDRSGNADIYKIRIDGGEPLQLTKDAGNDFAPSWSPNNREIAFHSSRSGVRRVYIIGAEGDNERQVTKQGGDVYAPDWSPDGKHIVFMTDFDSDRGVMQ
jgi:Tol biopolymer transport system component